MRNTLMIAAIVSALALPAVAEDRFAPNNPWFGQFEETCRDGAAMNEECQAGVIGAYVEYSGSSNVRCDFAAFWRVRDGKLSGDIIAALPWQNGVEAIVREPGVCRPA